MAKKDRPSDSVVAEALDHFEESDGATQENRKEAQEDIRFGRLNDQWPANIRKQREKEGRPVLSTNKLPAFIRQVVNDSRQNKPAITVVPVDSGADVDTAEVLGGLCRAIERGSNADVAYDTSLDHSVSGGFGFFRVSIDYAHSDSFEKELRIERIANPMSVHWDPSTTAFDASDWEYGFVSEWLTKGVFEQRYPGKQPVSFEGDQSDRIQTEAWMVDSVRLVEYFLRTIHKRKIVLLSNGETAREEDLKKPVEIAPGVKVPVLEMLALQGIMPVKDREADFYKVKRRILSGAEVLDEEDWPGENIPICPVWGEEVVADGRRRFRSLIRDARDPQMMFNFWRSASTELVALAPRAPFIAQKGSIPEGPEGEKWRTANTRSHPYLLYNNGNPPPQRQGFPQVPAAAIQEALNASDDMKAIMGIYDSSLGARSNETSGKAIMARQRESDTGTFHFIDNLARAIQYCGRVLIECIPSIYSERETIRILGQDMAPKVVKLARGAAPQQGIDTPADKVENRLYNLTTGKYDVVVKVGPSYSTQREQTRETLMELMRSSPEIVTIAGDLFAENLDSPIAPELAKRMKKMLPPQLQEGPDGQQAQPQIPPEMIEQGKQAIAENVQLKGQLQQKDIEAAAKDAQTQRQGVAADKANALKEIKLAEKEAQLNIRESMMNLRQAQAAAAQPPTQEQPAPPPA